MSREVMTVVIIVVIQPGENRRYVCLPSVRCEEGGGRREGTGRQHTCFTFHYQLDESWFPHFQLYHYHYLPISAISYKIICLSKIIGLNRFLYSFISVLSHCSFLISIISIHSEDYLSKQVISNLINIFCRREMHWVKYAKLRLTTKHFQIEFKNLRINNEDDIDIEMAKKQ